MQLTKTEKKVIKNIRKIKNDLRFGQVLIKIHEGSITRIHTTLKENIQELG